MQASEHYKVFIVDPDTAIRDSVALLLESGHLEVIGFADGRSFLKAAVPESGCCLLVESSLPDVSGLSVIAELRRLGNDVPTVLLTSSTDSDLAARVADLGVAGIVRKPLRSQQLVDQIEFLRHSTGKKQGEP